MLAHSFRELLGPIRDRATPGAVGPCGVDAIARIAVASSDGEWLERDDNTRARNPAAFDVALESEIHAAGCTHVAHGGEAFEEQFARHCRRADSTFEIGDGKARLEWVHTERGRAAHVLMHIDEARHESLIAELDNFGTR